MTAYNNESNENAVHMSISGKVILPLFLTVVGGFAAYATFYRFVERTRSDSTFIEIAGIQGVRAEHVSRLTYTLVQGFEWAREPLQESVERFDRELLRLEAGDGDTLLDPVPVQLEGALAEVRRTWEPIRTEALTVIELPIADPGAEAAYMKMRPLLSGLSEATQDLIHASQARTDGLRRRTMVTLGAICVVDVLLMALGFWMIRSMVVVRLQVLESAAHRVKDGDFSQPVPVHSRDEIGHVASAFNEMSSTLNELLARHAQSQAALRALSGKLLKAQDDERRRLAREIHDSTVQTLAAASIRLSGFRSTLEPDQDGAELETTRELLDTATNELRSLSYLLHPPMLDGLGLKAALEDHIAGFSERSGLVVDLDAETVGRLPEEVEFTVFRIVQESLWNIQRHAETQSATIRVWRDSDNVHLSVGDHGRGIEPVRLREIVLGHGGGVGISGMRERVLLLDGEFDMASDETGTTLRVSIPIRLDRADEADAILATLTSDNE